MSVTYVPGRNPNSKWWPEQPADDKVQLSLVQQTARARRWAKDEPVSIIGQLADKARRAQRLRDTESKAERMRREFDEEVTFKRSGK